MQRDFAGGGSDREAESRVAESNAVQLEPGARSPTRLLAFALSAILICTLLPCWFTPFWQTNDDVGMSMVAHGYGLAVVPSPALIYSNVIWGELVSNLPAIQGVLAYSWVTLFVLAACACGVAAGFASAGQSAAVTILVTTLVFARPFAFPQFTIVAGLAAVAGLALLASGSRVPGSGWKSAAPFLVIALLIRPLELALLGVVAAPFVPWRHLHSSRVWKRPVLWILVSLLVTPLVVDQLYYRQPEWREFRTLNVARIPFTDFDAGAILKSDRAALARASFSVNDVDLVGAWLLADSKIADPARLEELARGLQPGQALAHNSTKIEAVLRVLLSQELLPLVSCALVVGCLCGFRKQLALSWLLLLALLTSMALYGRVAPSRVSLAIVAALLVAPLLLAPRHERWRSNLVLVALVAATTWSLAQVKVENDGWFEASRQVRASLRDLPAGERQLVWGSAFPYELAYPVLLPEQKARKLRLADLGEWAVAPFAPARNGEEALLHLADRLRAGSVTLIAHEGHIALLRTYCAEHFRVDLSVLDKVDYGRFQHWVVTCHR